MILLTVLNTKYAMNNNLQDDFMKSFLIHFQSILANPELKLEDIKAELIPDEAVSHQNDANQVLDFEMDGFVRKAIITVPATESQPAQKEFIDNPIALKKLKSLVYDKDGNFLGNQFE